MAFTTKQVKDLNNSMKAAQAVSLGTLLNQTRSSYTAVAGDATANQMSIPTGLASVSGWIAQIYRAGVNVTEDAIFSTSSGNLVIADGAATYVVTAGDKVHFLAW